MSLVSLVANALVGEKGTSGWKKEMSCPREGRRKRLRVNVSKNRGKFKKRGHGQKIDFAHTFSV